MTVPARLLSDGQFSLAAAMIRAAIRAVLLTNDDA